MDAVQSKAFLRIKMHLRHLGSKCSTALSFANLSRHSARLYNMWTPLTDLKLQMKYTPSPLETRA